MHYLLNVFYYVNYINLIKIIYSIIFKCLMHNYKMDKQNYN